MPAGSAAEKGLFFAEKSDKIKKKGGFAAFFGKDPPA